mmetsp:Transcript_1956/g.4686  ORF Transcript_1956/g.4686 Transcript_1956/m.4686 type:complete len:242 (+) Transcript_1956:1066-1791(+)
MLRDHVRVVVDKKGKVRIDFVVDRLDGVYQPRDAVVRTDRLGYQHQLGVRIGILWGPVLRYHRVGRHRVLADVVDDVDGTGRRPPRFLDRIEAPRPSLRVDDAGHHHGHRPWVSSVEMVAKAGSSVECGSVSQGIVDDVKNDLASLGVQDHGSKEQPEHQKANHDLDRTTNFTRKESPQKTGSSVRLVFLVVVVFGCTSLRRRHGGFRIHETILVARSFFPCVKPGGHCFGFCCLLFASGK